MIELPTAFDGFRLGDWAKNPILGRFMALSMIFYYPLEHFAYVQWKAPETPLVPNALVPREKGRLADRASAWSCRFWLLYIVLDTLRAMLALRDASANGSKSNSLETRMERMQLIRNMLFTLPAAHWSRIDSTKPLISEGLRNSLMWIEAMCSLYQSVQS